MILKRDVPTFTFQCSGVHVSVCCVALLSAAFQFIPPSCLELASRAINVELHGFSYGVTEREIQYKVDFRLYNRHINLW